MITMLDKKMDPWMEGPLVSESQMPPTIMCERNDLTFHVLQPSDLTLALRSLGEIKGRE